jgi:DNA excision repair protein ERCC-4
LNIRSRINKNPQKYISSRHRIKFPDEFIIIIDTREQLPLFKDHPVKTIRATVRIGDYTIKGFEDKICFERKQLSDYYSYIGKERPAKTDKKLKAMEDMDIAGLVVEEDVSDLLAPQLYTAVHPDVAWGFLTSLTAKRGIHWFCNRDRGLIEDYIVDVGYKYWIEHKD